MDMVSGFVSHVAGYPFKSQRAPSLLGTALRHLPRDIRREQPSLPQGGSQIKASRRESRFSRMPEPKSDKLHKCRKLGGFRQMRPAPVMYVKVTEKVKGQGLKGREPRKWELEEMQICQREAGVILVSPSVSEG